MKAKIEIKTLKLESLEEFEGNPQKMTDKEFEGLVNSMKRKGWLLDDPVVWEYEKDKYKIISGHHRIKAGIKAGIEEKDCKVLYGIDKKTASLLVLEANQRRGKFNNLKLNKFIDDINIEFNISIDDIYFDIGIEDKEFYYKDFVSDVKEKIMHDLLCPKCGFKWQE